MNLVCVYEVNLAPLFSLYQQILILTLRYCDVKFQYGHSLSITKEEVAGPCLTLFIFTIVICITIVSLEHGQLHIRKEDTHTKVIM